MVLRAARLQGELKFENAKLLIFPDYSVETQRQRKSFDQVRAMLPRERGQVQYAFPCQVTGTRWQLGPVLYLSQRGGHLGQHSATLMSYTYAFINEHPTSRQDLNPQLLL